MALPSSGPIDFGSIQTEFGGTNPIGINEYYRNGGLVPSNNTNVPTSGTISLANFYGASNVSYWFAVLSTNIQNQSGTTNIVSDSNNNIYHLSHYNTLSTAFYDVLLLKYDSTGSFQWQKRIYQSATSDDYAYDVKIDSNNNIVCFINSSSLSSSNVLLTFNSSGTLVSSFNYTAPNPTALAARSFDLDSNNNIYFCGNGASIVKINSSGIIQYTNYIVGLVINGEDFYIDWSQIKTDSSGNSYLAGNSVIDYGSDYEQDQIAIVKVNSSGSIQWVKILGNIPLFLDSTNFYGMDIDNNNNIIIVGRYGTNALIVKYNSSGVMQWQRLLTTPRLYSVTTDSSGNIYAAGDNAGANPSLYIVKIDSSGNILWQRTFGQVSQSSLSPSLSNSIHIDSQGNIIMGARSVPDGTRITLKLPNDGSLTGTYGSYIYQSVNYTSSVSNVPETSYTYTPTTLNVSRSSVSYNIINPGFSSSTTNM